MRNNLRVTQAGKVSELRLKPDLTYSKVLKSKTINNKNLIVMVLT